jgi:hypothetical protein
MKQYAIDPRRLEVAYPSNFPYPYDPIPAGRTTIIEEMCDSLSSPYSWTNASTGGATVAAESYEGETCFKFTTGTYGASISTIHLHGLPNNFFNLPYSVSFILQTPHIPLDFLLNINPIGTYEPDVFQIYVYGETGNILYGELGNWVDTGLTVSSGDFYEYTFSCGTRHLGAVNWERHIKVYRALYHHEGGAVRTRTYLGEFTMQSYSGGTTPTSTYIYMHVQNYGTDQDTFNVYLADLRVYTYASDDDLPGLGIPQWAIEPRELEIAYSDRNELTITTLLDNDTAYWEPGWGNWYHDNFLCGHGGYYNNEYASTLRFPSVNIDMGTEIISAFIYLVASQTQSNTPRQAIKIYFEETDNALDASGYTEAQNILSRVGVSINSWYPTSWVEGYTKITPDLSSILQGIIDRPGWVSGNAIRAVFYETINPTPSVNNIAPAYGNSGATKPVIVITYTTHGWISEPRRLEVAYPTLKPLTFSPLASGDDGKWWTSGGYPAGFDTAAVDISWGFNGYGTGSRAFIRFPYVTYDQGTVITNAILTFTVAGVSLVGSHVHAYDVADAPAPITYAEADGMGVTTLSANLVGTPLVGQPFRIDVSAIVQYLIDKEDWLSGNAILFIFHWNSGTIGYYMNAYTIDYDSGSKVATLTITPA